SPTPLAISFDGSSINIRKDGLIPSKKSKRFSGFDFYRRKLFSPVSSPPTTPSHSPPNFQSHLSITDAGREPLDPTTGFHPLISTLGRSSSANACMVPATLPVLRYPSNLVPFSTLPPSTRLVFQTRMASRRHLRPPSNLHCANLRQGRLQYASSPFASTRDITLLWHVLRCSTRHGVSYDWDVPRTTKGARRDYLHRHQQQRNGSIFLPFQQHRPPALLCLVHHPRRHTVTIIASAKQNQPNNSIRIDYFVRLPMAL
ncbi:hypothetical protein EV363DRAFT_1558208, partial [Boletus edulis]